MIFANFVGSYIHSLSQVYTPDSAIYSHGCNCRVYIAESGVYMPYMMPCGTFDPPTHYSIYCYTHTHTNIYKPQKSFPNENQCM